MRGGALQKLQRTLFLLRHIAPEHHSAGLRRCDHDRGSGAEVSEEDHNARIELMEKANRRDRHRRNRKAAGKHRQHLADRPLTAEHQQHQQPQRQASQCERPEAARRSPSRALDWSETSLSEASRRLGSSPVNP